MRFKSKAVQVKINRSAQFSPVVRVFEHEVPVLQVIHGEESVFVMPAGKGEPAVRVFDSNAERARLVNKYPRVGEPGGARICPTEVAYGNRMNSTLGKGMEAAGAEPEDDPDDEQPAPAKPAKPKKAPKRSQQIEAA